MRVRRAGIIVVTGVVAVGLSTVGPAVSAREKPGAEVLVVPFKVPDGIQPLEPGDGAVYVVTKGPRGRLSFANRVSADGTVTTEPVEGAALSGLVEASDGTRWLSLQSTGGGGVGSASSAGAFAGFDPTSLAASVVPIAPDDAAPIGAPTVADVSGRVWTLAGPQTGLYAVAAGTSLSSVSVPTELVELQTLGGVVNPVVPVRGGPVWLLGGDGASGGPRITAVNADGVVVDVAPAGYDLAFGSLTRVAGRVWAVVADAGDGSLVALGVGASGGTRAIATSLSSPGRAAAQAVRDRRGRLWFPGVGGRDELLVAEVDVRHDRVQEHDTSLRLFPATRNLLTSVLPTGGGAIVAGVDRRIDGHLAFARIGTRDRVWVTRLRPFAIELQEIYPIISDGCNGAWAQGLDERGDLVVVHVTPHGVRASATGLRPGAKSVVVGPDKNLWTQALDGDELVIVSVSPKGALTTYPTGYQAPGGVPAFAPASDDAGHLWFKAADGTTGNLVLIRLTVTEARR